MQARLELSQIQKRFGATVALEGTSLTVQPGEIHALIGENGAGKSTLMKILSGALSPDSGRILLDGQTHTPDGPIAAREAGIAMIYQELNLLPHLSVEENLLLGREPRRWGWLRRAELRQQARDALRQLGADDVPLDAPVASLTIAQQQLVEIARALACQPRVLIMDEPTSSLTQSDVDRLFGAIRGLRERGVSIVYISHFLEECQRIANRYTVLRDGKNVTTGQMAEVSLDEIVRAMVGREVAEIYDLPSRRLGETVLEVRGLSGLIKPTEVSLRLRAGEIFGLAGLIGSGRTESARALFGLDKMRAGTVQVFGRESGARPTHLRMAEGFGMVSENRKEEGLLLNRGVADNLLLSNFEPLARHGFISLDKERKAARRWIERLEIKANQSDQAIGQLSGGNQQKVALGRLLHQEAKILLLDEPTRGIDVGSKQQIYRLMGNLAERGRAILFISSYLPELFGVCDTIGVMSRGRLVAARPRKNWTEHEIMAHATGAPAAA